MNHRGVCDDPNCPLKKFEQQAKARQAIGQLYVNDEFVGDVLDLEIVETSQGVREVPARFLGEGEFVAMATRLPK